MALSHIFSSPVADFTGTVTVFDSNGQTATTNATALVRPSNWNSVHNEFYTITGNTNNASTISGTNIHWSGGNGVTIIGSSNSIGWSVNTSYRASNDAIGLNSAFTAGPLAMTVNSSGLSLNAGSAAGTSSGFTGGASISGSMTHNTAGLAISLSHPAWLTTAAQSNHSHGNPQLNLTNLSGTTASNSAGFTLSLSAAAPGGVTLTNYATGNTTQSSSGTIAGSSVIVRGSGGVSAGISNGSYIVHGPELTSLAATGALSASSNGSTISLGVGTVTAYATSNTTGASSATIDLGSIVVRGAGIVSAGISAGTIIVSASAAGAADGYNLIAAGTQTANTTGTVLFQNSNGITFGMSNSSVVTASHNGLTTAAQSDHSHGNPTLALTNLSGTTASASNGLTLSLSAAAQTSQSAIRGFGVSNTGATAGNTGISTGVDWVLAGSQSLTLSQSTAGGGPNTVWIQHPAWITTARASNDAVGLNTAQTNVTWTVNSAGLSLNAAGYAGTGTSITGGAAITLNSNGLQFNGAALAGTGTTFAGANISASMTLNSAGLNLSASVAAPGAAAENNAINLLGANTAGNTTATGSTIGWSGINLTLSGTNGSQVVISASAQSNQTVGMYALGNTTQNSSTTLDARTLSLNALGAMTAGYSNGSIQLSAPATSSLVGSFGVQVSTNGSTITVQRNLNSYYAYPFNVMVNTQTIAPQSNTSYVFPIEIVEPEAIAFGRGPQTVSISSMASIATTANTTFSYNQEGTFNIVMYTRGTGASSQSLQSVLSSSYSSRGSINVQANANGSQWSVTHGYSFPASNTAQATTSFSYATSLTNINISTTHMTIMTGAKIVAGPLSTTLQPAQYWMAFGNQTAQTTNGAASLSNMRSTASYLALSQVNLTWGEFGSASASSIQNNYGIGSYTKAATGTTDSIAFSQISSASSHLVPYFTFVRIA